jgi:hypothetical protein
MVSEKKSAEQTVAAPIDWWSEVLEELCGRIARRFRRPEVRGRLRRYLGGLLGNVERKNSWQMAEAIGEAGPRGVQRLLNGTRWDANGVRDISEATSWSTSETKRAAYSSWTRPAS